MNMTMSGKEKLYFLLDAIIDARDIAPSGQPLLIDPTNDLNRKYRGMELEQLFTKLEKDEKVLKVLQTPNRVKNALLEEAGQYREMDDGCYHIELLPTFDKYFLRIQLEPEYFEFTGKKPSPEQTFEIEIDDWLSKKELWALQKIWQVVSALNSEWQLRDQDIFKIPLDKFTRARTNEHDLEAILISLHNKKFIDVSRKLGETPPSNDPNKPEGSIWTTVDDQPEIIRREDTQVEIFPKKFGYLVKKLSGLVKEKSPNIQGEDLKKRYNELIEEIKSQGMSSSGNLEERYIKILGEIKSQKSSQPSDTQATAVSLKDKEIKYDDKEARIVFDGTICQLPPYKNEHYLCGVMFKKKANQPVDWSVVYEKMSGNYEKHYGKTPKTREHWRTVYDTMIRVNNRIKKELNTTDDLFLWQELTIKRNF